MKTVGEVVVPRRFRGPPDSGNGGYVAGLVARFAPHTVRVRLMRPPPLEKPLEVVALDDGALLLRDGELALADARPCELDLEVPRPPGYLEAIEASLACPGLRHHPAPDCFVCGTARARGDGLRLFAGPVTGRAIVAAPWTPDESLGHDGKAPPEIMFAVLDCPGAFTLWPAPAGMLLGSLAGHVHRLARIGRPHVVIGWRIGQEGRKLRVGTAIFEESGDLCGLAEGIWILPREPAS
jgi:hypothetical protein